MTVERYDMEKIKTIGDAYMAVSAYDIWGDTVNTAARMEKASESGRINVSKTTYQLVKHEFNCEYRGKINAKKFQ